MLILQKASSPQEPRELLKNFNPELNTWLVSDLKSKTDINREFLRTRNFVPATSVMRASELWRTLLSRLRPDLQVVSREFMIAFIGQRLAEMDQAWARGPRAALVLFEYMSQLIPILSHPEGEAMMCEWFKTEPSAQNRWGNWYALSHEIWTHVLSEGIVAPTWAAGLLSNEVDVGNVEVWSRPLVVDLGVQLNRVEADVLLHLARSLEVIVLTPEPSWSGGERALSAYRILSDQIGTEKRPAAPLAQSQRANRTYKKFTTMIAEVQDAVAQVRQWLDSIAGLEPAKIAVAAPDIELYWPALLSQLLQEGIPLQKDQVQKLHVMPDVARWLSILRLKAGGHSESDLETALVDDSIAGPQKLISYERFKTLYGVLYGREDLARSAAVAARFAVEVTGDQLLTRDEFLAFAIQNWPENLGVDSDLSAAAGLEHLKMILARVFADGPAKARLSMKLWLHYLEEVAAKTEVKIRVGDATGVAVLNLSSAEHSQATHVVLLGLTDKNLRTSTRTAILQADAFSLNQRFGFHLSDAGEEQSGLCFEAKWLISDSQRHFVLSLPESDFAGSPQSASLFWLEGARLAGVHEQHRVPAATRWAELQQTQLATVARLRSWPEPKYQLLNQSLNEDFGIIAREAILGLARPRLSPSAIEDYLKCPFIFAAKRVFKLSDQKELDLEVDPSRRGSLMHKLFELLTAEPMKFDWSADELGALVEKSRVAAEIELGDEGLWPMLKENHVDLARRFLELEKLIRAQFPQTQTVGREVQVKGYLDAESGAFSASRRHPDDFEFSGRIDRIDRDDLGHLVIYDYKSSTAAAKQFGSWLKNNQIQLLLYAMAVEAGLATVVAAPVVGALYYVAKTLERDNGFKVKDVSQNLFSVDDSRKRNRLNHSEKVELFANTQTRVLSVLDGIRDGRFPAEPSDRKTCTNCPWSAICRAPHLNI